MSLTLFYTYVVLDEMSHGMRSLGIVKERKVHATALHEVETALIRRLETPHTRDENFHVAANRSTLDPNLSLRPRLLASPIENGPGFTHEWMP